MSWNNCLLSKDGTELILGCKTSVIPDSVTSIRDRAFEGCSGLQSIEVSQDNDCFMSRNNCLLSKEGTRLLLGCKTSVIPSGVISIGTHAFSGCSSLLSVEIPDSVTYIEDGAFLGCSGLLSIELPSGVTSIGDRAFSGCSGLLSIEIPDSVTYIKDFAFLGCINLSSLTLHYDDPNNLSFNIVRELPISDKITLHVPIGTGYAYRHHPVFSKVKEVIADVR